MSDGSAGIPTPDNTQFGQRIREFALVALGHLPNRRLDSFVTLRMLKDAGVINVNARSLTGGPGAAAGGGGIGPVVVERGVDLTPPPVPSGFQATAGTTQILFETAAPIYRQGHGHARTKIYAAPWDGVSPLPTFSDAVLYTDFPGNIGVAPFDPASALQLWATWTSVDGKESEPAGGINGVAAATGLLEDVHIANLAVGKLLAGSLAVGQYIQSADYVAGTTGWRIQTLSGGGAYLEINGGATIGGLVVGADNISSSNYVLNTTGYRFKSDGTAQIGGIQVTTQALQSSNFVSGSTGFRMRYNGDIEASNMNLYGGTLIASVIKNSTDSVHFDLGATGSSLMLRAGPSTSYGPYAGTHYPVEIYADGSAFFGRGVVAGGQLKASGTYTIPDKERPAVIFVAGLGPGAGGGSAGDTGP